MLTALVVTLTLAAPPTLKVKVDGEGYLRFVNQGRVVYAATATLGVTGGVLSHANGSPLLPAVRIPGTASSLEVSLEGEVLATTTTGKSTVGRLVLAMFKDGKGLTQNGAFLISTSRPSLANPGEGLAGVIRVEGSSIASVSPLPQPKTQKGTKSNEPASITVSLDSEAAGDKILLGDIAKIDGSPAVASALQSVVVGDTPPIGIDRGIDAGQINARLRLAGYDLSKITLEVPQGAKVHRRSQVVKPEAFEKAALEAAQKVLGETIPLQAKTTGTDFRAPHGELEIIAENCTPNSSGATVIVVVKVDGRRYNSRLVQVKPAEEAMGVKIGAAITIVLVSGGAAVEVPGQAKTNGFVGQTVSVKTSTGADLSGTVKAANRVEVKL